MNCSECGRKISNLTWESPSGLLFCMDCAAVASQAQCTLSRPLAAGDQPVELRRRSTSRTLEATPKPTTRNLTPACLRPYSRAATPRGVSQEELRSADLKVSRAEQTAVRIGVFLVSTFFTSSLIHLLVMFPLLGLVFGAVVVIWAATSLKDLAKSESWGFLLASGLIFVLVWGIILAAEGPRGSIDFGGFTIALIDSRII